MTELPQRGRGERALELQEKGLSTSQIKERLGFWSSAAACVAIKKAKERREKKTEVVA